MSSKSDYSAFSPLAEALIKNFGEKTLQDKSSKITVNILVTKVASWYEKLRTSMDYGNEETILRRAIERILKRRLFLDADPKSLAEDIVRELVWAGYFKDATLPESTVDKVANSINLYLNLKDRVIKEKLVNEDVYEFTMQVLSCEIDIILLPNKEMEAMSNFMFHILKNSVDIADDSKQTRNAQVFIAVRKNFARDDIAFLKYRLFTQLFGKLSRENLESVVANFAPGIKEIEYQLSYPKKDRVFNHIKKKTPPFLILYDILMRENGEIRNIFTNGHDFREKVFAACENRYKNIGLKVRTAVIRSFVFILFTKALIAITVEGTFERIVYGSIQWLSIALNTLVSPLIMIIAGLGIKTPDRNNSQVIYEDIHKLLFEENPQIVPNITLRLKKNSAISLRDRIFSLLWFLSIILIFGLIGNVLGRLHFNIVSQAIFLFFLAIISFLTYRIYQTANTYTVIYKQNILTPILDFFFVPIIRVGRRLTEGISQINFLLIVIDFIIEAPFKGLVGFFEQWFLFLAAKKEELE